MLDDSSDNLNFTFHSLIIRNLSALGSFFADIFASFFIVVSFLVAVVISLFWFFYTIHPATPISAITITIIAATR
jgi:hypothetical protein